MPWVIELRVVSLPATASMITKKPNSSSESFSPSMSAWISAVTMSSVGFLPRSSAICIAYMISSIEDCAGSTSANSGSSPPVISLDQRNSLSRSSWGTPSSPAMACNGSSQLTCSTKSPLPSAAAVLAMFSARCASSSSSRPIARGVNPREMILRNRVWCGASMLSITLRCNSTFSRVISFGQIGIAPFCQLEKTSLRRDTSLTSSCLVTSQ